MKSITLSGVSYPVKPMPLGRLKLAITAFGRAGAAFARGDMSEKTLDDVSLIISYGIGISVEEVEQIPAALPELAEALDVIAQVAGLRPSESTQGEGAAVAATPSTGTTSTAG